MRPNAAGSIDAAAADTVLSLLVSIYRWWWFDCSLEHRYDPGIVGVCCARWCWRWRVFSDYKDDDVVAVVARLTGLDCLFLLLLLLLLLR